MNVPLATYRLQLHKEFSFRSVEAILPYLQELGISHVYASPVTRARPGSSHGYDCVDPSTIHPELGTPEQFEELLAKVCKRSMGWLQDIVPNHMAFHIENPMLADVLENGPFSEYYHFFDIEWNHPYPSLKGRLLAPFLSSYYGQALSCGEIQLQFQDGAFYVAYHGLKFPLRIESYATVLGHCLPAIRQRLGAQHLDHLKFLGVLYTIRNLSSAESPSERKDQVRFVKQMLRELVRGNRDIRASLEATLRTFNGDVTNPSSFQLLDRLLSEQYFRLSLWKVATEEINYRRFFTVNDLIAVRSENPEVFERTHGFLLELVRKGWISGLRIDHIDGLYDPTAYLNRLRSSVPEAYLLVEKIVDAVEETLPENWPVEGTTGYDFLGMVTGLFCDRNSLGRMDRLFRDFAAVEDEPEELVREEKRFVVQEQLAGDLDRVALAVHGLCARLWFGPDVTLNGLRRALAEVVACLPVYRTYVTQEGPSAQDRRFIEQAISQACASQPELLNELGFIRQLLLLELPHPLPEEDKAELADCIARFQQISGPAMAKGFEDCFFYIYNRLLSLNEVGCNPIRFGVLPDEFHTFLQKRAMRWPYSLNATSTHDTKRGEDARARLNVLSELAEEWESHVWEWRRLNEPKKRDIGGVWAPDPNMEYFLYQSLVASFPWDLETLPSFRQRVSSFVVKACREAKTFSTWHNPHLSYEEACVGFATDILNPELSPEFWKSFLPFVRRVAHYGAIHSLAQTALKLFAPGVPDFYQGSELWDLSFVDPDNRRRVDFDLRKRLLRQVREAAGNTEHLSQILSNPKDGRIKLYVIYHGLRVRKEYRDVMEKGDYIPMTFRGSRRDHVFGFIRRFAARWVMVVVPRFSTALVEEGMWPVGETVWSDTYAVLPADAPPHWNSGLTVEKCVWKDQAPVGQMLGQFPVGVWTSG
ncbi:malto-oligosyltrehalose synthase [Candidatus Methylacidithermus pantelleriae]|uniref:Malto-oligosyltrehalose synthase n=1 Tax=Candidatus Methylacidithermus pantelleriae TaxID=2744239 RepID=A0A8J2FTN6_9BACT|nr:malto-oligosyltrehalose synthase [Candidatus Methylacidithermus pantelleriae]CAF0703702.1 Malto-oligosyltrehalose synthase [Candidatus Methylacidithermus pantelleriae]